MIPNIQTLKGHMIYPNHILTTIYFTEMLSGPRCYDVTL